MQITRLHIERVRNLTTVALSQLQPFNIFYGANGSGKTSILEAIHLLATGRSFRTHIPKHYIQHQHQDMIVFAQSDTEKIGIKKLITGEQIMRVNGDTVATQSQLAKSLPLQYIEPQSTDILDHGAKPRRQMLDWLMFHVEPDFYIAWQHYARALKQRNTLLKTSRSVSLESMDTWNVLLAKYGEMIHHFRLGIIEQWTDYLNIDLKELLPALTIEMSYSAGFNEDVGLYETLRIHHEKDLERRYTEYGPHKADLKLKTPLGAADDILSRGQKKLLITALKLSQIAMLHASNRETVVLLDDLTAELDFVAQHSLIKRLSQLDSQVFITTLDQKAVTQHLNDLGVSCRMFHVEHGRVDAVLN